MDIYIYIYIYMCFVICSLRCLLRTPNMFCQQPSHASNPHCMAPRMQATLTAWPSGPGFCIVRAVGSFGDGIPDAGDKLPMHMLVMGFHRRIRDR